MLAEVQCTKIIFTFATHYEQNVGKQKACNIVNTEKVNYKIKVN